MGLVKWSIWSAHAVWNTLFEAEKYRSLNLRIQRSSRGSCLNTHSVLDTLQFPNMCSSLNLSKPQPWSGGRQQEETAGVHKVSEAGPSFLPWKSSSFDQNLPPTHQNCDFTLMDGLALPQKTEVREDGQSCSVKPPRLQNICKAKAGRLLSLTQKLIQIELLLY